MRTITVKGTGRVKAAVDYVVITMSLDATDQVYDAAMERAAEQLEELTASMTAVGFEKDAVKTTNFNVNTEYVSEKDELGNYKRVFDGYKVSHQLKLEFDFDTAILAKVLSAIGTCPAKPELHIRFTVKDGEMVKEEVLRQAAVNARQKAEVLCAASGAKLGELVTIDYNWSEIGLYSDTSYRVAEDCMMKPMLARSVEITPEDVEASDTVTFVWEIG